MARASSVAIACPLNRVDYPIGNEQGWVVASGEFDAMVAQIRGDGTSDELDPAAPCRLLAAAHPATLTENIGSVDKREVRQRLGKVSE